MKKEFAINFFFIPLEYIEYKLPYALILVYLKIRKQLTYMIINP